MEAEKGEEAEEGFGYRAVVETGGLYWRDRGRGDDLQLAYLLPKQKSTFNYFQLDVSV